MFVLRYPTLYIIHRDKSKTLVRYFAQLGPRTWYGDEDPCFRVTTGYGNATSSGAVSTWPGLCSSRFVDAERLLQCGPGKIGALDAHRELADPLQGFEISQHRTGRSGSSPGSAAPFDAHHALEPVGEAAYPRRGPWPLPRRPSSTPRGLEIEHPCPVTPISVITPALDQQVDTNLVAAEGVAAVGAGVGALEHPAIPGASVVIEDHLAVTALQETP